MLLNILGFLLISIFLLLSLLHFYWAVGGRWAFETALPSNEKGEITLKPGFWACTVVGLGLFAFGAIFAWYLDWINLNFLPSVLLNSIWVIASIFLIRAFGDFKYVGFFKQLKTTAFAKLDTQIYSPLCLIISVLALLIGILN